MMRKGDVEMSKNNLYRDSQIARTKKKVRAIAQTIIAIAVTLTFAFPLYWMINTSMKSHAEMTSVIPTWLPIEGLHWENYAAAFAKVPLLRYMLNTIYVTALQLILQLGTGVLAAYGFARGNFPCKNLLFTLVLGALMIPQQVTFIPMYILISKLDWVDTFAGLVLPASVSAYMIFMLRQNFMSVDQSYLDAGRLDGLGIVGTIRHILVPMCRSSIATVTFVTLMDGWNNYFWPKILVKSDGIRPIALGLAYLKNTWDANIRFQNFNILMAAVLISLVPVVILFALNQGNMLSGYSKAAMK